MAFETIPSWTVTFSLLGAFDGERKKVVEFAPAGVDAGAQFTALLTDISTFITAFTAVSGAFISGYSIGAGFDELDAAPAFTGVEDVYREAQIQADLLGKNRLHSTWIPSPLPAIFVGGSVNTNRIDTADADYLAYGALFTDGSICRVSDGDVFTAPLNVRSADLRSVRSGKSY